ncbi:Uma2 family endonuclease [Romeria aff. gracilis LEGE 07310]|uniref:Uma2 family endonuclease n=1 Tax=Vasconcelosia minhoensis LEGE 07310 TaxID=915328 RepID=A0A8J7AG20_9CYAN|nr:Uma2 family endonuclease [Romeria gracilis]MBE9078209.1 Uma2 family endonuclease [Romeria aff. gracilis LEGE 07310]
MAAILLDLSPVICLSDDQFYDLCAKNPELRLERSATGELAIMSPTGGETGKRNSDINLELALWNRQAKLGVVFDSSTGFKLPNGAERSPDAAWIPQAKWEGLSPEQRRRFLPLCPDFVVELMSPSDTWEDLLNKMTEYQANGARLGWLIDPENKRVAIFRLGKPIELLENLSVIYGENVLPGFSLTIGNIW